MEKTDTRKLSTAAQQEKRKAISHLRKLQKLPGRIKRYFKHPKITYAGAAI